MLLRIVSFACLAGFLYGYDEGLIGGAAVFFSADLGLSPSGLGGVVAAAKVGALGGAWVGAAAAAGRPVEVWAFDEHRLGLKPLIRRVWARRGRRPVAVSSHKYKWLYLYGFVRPTTGDVEWWVAD